ncbi:hypothetical protein BC833DRAFT_582025 [Globomyces pollinis-pini]|nr:hypothetical protein BC833DRAFT_582025 [Globomyces pollinis-pini]
MRFFSLITTSIAKIVDPDIDYFASPPYLLSLSQNNNNNNIITPTFNCQIQNNLLPYSPPIPDLNLALSYLASLPCLYYHVDKRFWAYEFCINKSFLQFHPKPKGEPLKPDERFVLGLPTKLIHSSIGQTTTNGEQIYSVKQTWGYSHHKLTTFSGGTICQLTGLERVTHVEFTCASDEKIRAIRELSTCVYLVLIDTPRLCDLPAFLPQKPTLYPQITCSSPLLSLAGK